MHDKAFISHYVENIPRMFLVTYILKNIFNLYMIFIFLSLLTYFTYRISADKKLIYIKPVILEC